jgi:hypothetical protein
MDDGDPRDEIVRLEAHIEALAARLDSCHKFMLAARIAMTAGAIVLAALVFGAIRFDPTFMAAAATVILGGIVVFGSNNSTAKETTEELTAAESRRAALIGSIDLRVISDRPTLH